MNRPLEIALRAFASIALFVSLAFGQPTPGVTTPGAAQSPTETSGGWLKFTNNPVLGGKYGTCFDISVLKEDDTYGMWLSWRPKKSLALVESADGIQWGEPKIILGPNADTEWEKEINRPVVLKRGETYWVPTCGVGAGGRTRTAVIVRLTLVLCVILLMAVETRIDRAVIRRDVARHTA